MERHPCVSRTRKQDLKSEKRIEFESHSSISFSHVAMNNETDNQRDLYRHCKILKKRCRTSNGPSGFYPSSFIYLSRQDYPVTQCLPFPTFHSRGTRLHLFLRFLRPLRGFEFVWQNNYGNGNKPWPPYWLSPTLLAQWSRSSLGAGSRGLGAR